MAQFQKQVRVASNPHASGSRATGHGRKKEHTMAKAGKRKPNGGGKSHHRKATNGTQHHRRRRRNPSGIAGTIGTPKELIVGGVAGLAGAVATRQIPQMILGANNAGMEGYAANLVTALLSGWLAGMFAGPSAGRGALIGGAVIVLDRVLSDNVSPIASYISLSGVGDANAYSKLGTIRAGYYTHPGIQNPDGSLYVPDPYTDAAVAAVLAKYPQVANVLPPNAGGGNRVGAVNPSAMRRHVANGMVLSSRFQNRFNQAS